MPRGKADLDHWRAALPHPAGESWLAASRAGVYRQPPICQQRKSRQTRLDELCDQRCRPARGLQMFGDVRCEPVV